MLVEFDKKLTMLDSKLKRIYDDAIKDDGNLSKEEKELILSVTGELIKTIGILVPLVI